MTTQGFDKDSVLKTLQWYEAAKQENISPETLSAWVIALRNMGYSTEQANKRIKEAAYKKIYGKTTLDIFIDDSDEIIDYYILDRMAKQKIKNMLSKFFELEEQNQDLEHLLSILKEGVI